jgi:hypothetical protein
LAALAMLCSQTACGTVAVLAPEPTLKPGQRTSIPGTQMSLEIPKPFKRHDDRTWVVRQDDQIHTVMRVVVQKKPKGNVDSWIDQRIVSVGRGGQAGILRNETVTLGDINGRLIVAQDLRGTSRNGLMQMVAQAEDGLYVVTFAGPVSILHKHGALLVKALSSVRVASP